MKRRIIKINEDLCNGCGLCAAACHEGAIGMENGKAKLLRDDYCDGLGNCLPACPTGAITFEEREALPFDEVAVQAKQKQHAAAAPSGGCPGTRARAMHREAAAVAETPQAGEAQSQLMQWPVQIKLVPVNAPYFQGANLLIAADCAAYAYAGFHEKFMRNHVTLIGCPKLDEGDYAEKLAAILQQNEIRSVTVVRMQVPCCSGIASAVQRALVASGKMIPWRIAVISTEGTIIDET